MMRTLLKFCIVAWVTLTLLGLSVGCGFLDELLPTSSEIEEGTVTSESSSSSTSSAGSPSTPYPAPTTGVSAPEIQSPSPGTDVLETSPTLVVANSATGDSFPVTYSFEVATDDTFQTVIATEAGISQGEGGKTSWQVSETLGEGTYFWRARAQAGYVKSSYSLISNFNLVPQSLPPEVPIPTPGGGVATVSDPLTNGTSIGEVNGGRFTSEGWEVVHRTDYIRYEVQPLESGFVEWNNTGLRESNLSADHFMLFGMWDPTKGDYRANPYRVHLQKLDTNHNRPYVRIRWIANGEQHDDGYNFLDWNPNQTYQWLIEWGPNGGSNEVRVYLDGMVIIQTTYRRAYKPNAHWVELGIQSRVESVVGAIYSNLRIGPR